MLWRLSGGDTGRAEDWLQDSFHRAWQTIGSLKAPERFGAWLKRLALNTALADRRRPSLQLVDGSKHPIHEIEPPWPASDLDLERAVASLPDRAREVLVLFCMEGFSHAEIADRMQTDIGTSKAQLHRARQLLQERLS
jgi:RNA polymerase sigma-70 factor (ECF subfamily)